MNFNLPQILDLNHRKLRFIPKNISDIYSEIDLEYNNITKIENIKHLTNLKRLIICSNRISKIENLPPNLEELYIGYNFIKKINNLPSKLKILSLTNNAIKKIENIEHLVNLERLNIDFNVISKIQNISNLRNLKYLKINNNEIEKIENLPPNLLKLDISANIIDKLENIGSKLCDLSISYNNIINPINNLRRYRQFEKNKWLYFKLQLSSERYGYNKYICNYLRDIFYR